MLGLSPICPSQDLWVMWFIDLKIRQWRQDNGVNKEEELEREELKGEKEGKKCGRQQMDRRIQHMDGYSGERQGVSMEFYQCHCCYVVPTIVKTWSFIETIYNEPNYPN